MSQSSFFHRRLSWLLWMVLLIPMLQSVETMHLFSHVHVAQAQTDAQPPVPDDSCDLCLGAAAMLGGAPLAAAASLMPPQALHEPTHFDLSGTVLAAPLRAYNSRAPPFSLL